ncbi:MAG: TonB-dependent receptor [Rhodanobacter sp.]
MTTLSGTTRNGFTYEADYETASGGRILWNATFRRDGDYAGIRHGRLLDMTGVAAGKVDEEVRISIESTWTSAT